MDQNDKEIRRVGDLEINVDLELARRLWKFQRIAWKFMSLIILLGLAGVFGVGPVSRAHAENESLRVEYERFARLKAPLELTVHLLQAPIEGGPAALRIDRQYLDRVRINTIMPQPVRVESSEGRVAFYFQPLSPEGSLPVTFFLTPEHFGHTRLRIGGSAGPPLELNQWIYP